MCSYSLFGNNVGKALAKRTFLILKTITAAFYGYDPKGLSQKEMSECFVEVLNAKIAYFLRVAT